MKQHILIVDDEASIRELLQAYFDKQGYQTTTAPTAAEALSAAQNVHLDLIILDVVLTDADGLELLGNLKKMHPNLPIIVMTGIGFDETLLAEAKRKGASGYVSKTLPLNKLLTEVREILSPK